MIVSVSANLQAAYNVFNPKNAVVGWYDEITTNPDCSFRTSEMIAVTAGDVICFGAAVTGQGWHMVAYDAAKRPLQTIFGTQLEIAEPLNELTSIMRYTVQDGVSYIRMICDTRFVNGYLVTKNRIFTAAEYRSFLTESSAEQLTNEDARISGEWLIFLTVKGSGMMTAGEQTFSFEPGTIVCVPPAVHFHKVSAEGYCDIEISATDFLLKEQLIVAEDDNNQSMKTLVELIAKVYWNPNQQYRPFLDSLYETLQQFILYRITENSYYDPQVTVLVRTMEASFTDPDLSIEQILQQGDYCPNHLRRIFTKTTGCSPVEYLINLRIDHAKKLLRQNEFLHFTVTQIAQQCGFDDISYFSRLFKKKVGISPMLYMAQTQFEK